jgi:hypothetical protein
VDPALGASTAFAGSRINMAMFLGFGSLATLLVLQAPPESGAQVPGLVIGGLFLFGAFCVWRTRLLVGERGFRYSSLLGTDEIPWNLVSECRVGYSIWMGCDWVAVVLPGGRDDRDPHPDQMNIGILGFSARLDEISDLMNVRRRRWETAARRLAAPQQAR